MVQARSKFVLVYLFALAALLPAATAQRTQEEDPTAELTFVVLKDDNGKPVRNAAVIMHVVSTKGKQGRGGLELKTDSEGKTSFDGIPYGTLRVQVLAQGFQTFGQDYEVDRAKMDFTIKLKRPQNQFTIYDTDDKKNQKPPADPSAKPQ